MTTPVGPKDFPLSRDWWLSGSAWHKKTADDVFAVLGVEGLKADEKRAAANAYYAEHPDRRRFVPNELRQSLGLRRVKRAFIKADATPEQLDAFIRHLIADED